MAPANTKVTGWGLIGASTIAQEFMVDAIRANGGQPLWVMSQSADHVAAFAKKAGIDQPTTDLPSALADDRVQAVYISSANSRHHHQVLAAAKAGKHILCDKPLATTSANALAMIEACQKAGVVLAVNHHLRASRLHQTMRQMIADGVIGDVRSMSIVHAGLLRPVLQTWRIKDSAEGAIYLDLSVHDIDLARYLLQQEPVSVVGLGAAMSLGVGDIHDHAMYAMTMSGGAFFQAHESFVTPDVESQVSVFGSKGALCATGTLSQRAGGILLLRQDGQVKSIDVAPVDLYAETIAQFLRAIDGSGTPLATGRDGMASLSAAEKVHEAVTRGQRVVF